MLTDNEHVDEQELADEMNRHFANIGHNDGQDERIDNCPKGHILSRSVVLSPSTPTEIEAIIAQLKNGATAGDHGIKALPLKYTASIVSPTLSHITNVMLKS